MHGPLAWLCDLTMAWGLGAGARFLLHEVSGCTAGRCRGAGVLYEMYGVKQIGTHEAEMLT